VGFCSTVLVRHHLSQPHVKTSKLLTIEVAGKDRTGVLAALILALVDTPPDIITKDYALTRIGIEPFREKLLGILLQMMGRESQGEEFDEPGMEALCGVRGPTIIAFLEWMEEKWGAFGTSSLYLGVDGYLREELGFSSEDLESIRRTLRV
jgi:protein tyrosine/serine phosphatase